MSAQHTPAPWTHGDPMDDSKTIRSKTRLVCKVYAAVNRAEEKANASYIATAPELLECLTMAVAMYEAYILLAQPPHGDFPSPGKWVNDARDAIAKAQGGDQ